MEEAMKADGLLVGDVTIPVIDVHVDNRNTAAWAKLNTRDYYNRKTTWVRQAIVHTTKGIWPQKLVESLPGGKDKVLADFYGGDPEHNGCHTVADLDGTGACLADLLRKATYQATTSNEYSWGHEIYQLGDGTITRASLRATVEIIVTGCRALGMPLQMHYAPYKANTIVARMRDGGADCVGIFGHNDQSWKEPRHLTASQRVKYPDGYAGRGRGDPGDTVKDFLAADPRIEHFDYSKHEDLRAWERRQRKLNALGHSLTVDGVCGPSTMQLMAQYGFEDGRALDRAVELPNG
jgi:hypothetical protein